MAWLDVPSAARVPVPHKCHVTDSWYNAVALYANWKTCDIKNRYCHIFRVCEYIRGTDWWMDLVPAYRHHSELQVIIALSLISTLYKSQQHPLSHFSVCCVFNSRSLATSSNSGDSSAFRDHVVTARWTSRNWTLVNCQLNYGAISSQPPLQSLTQLPNLNSLTHSPANQLLFFTSLHFTSVNWTANNCNEQRTHCFKLSCL
jgi:hypothetical protein